MKTFNLLLFTTIFSAIGISSFAQQKFIADDGINSSKPNKLELTKTGEADNVLFYEATPNECVVKWQTSQECNTSHFEMQISFDGSTFAGVQLIAASDYTVWKTDYKLTFRKSYLSLNKIFYRLKAVFADNAVIYSDPVTFTILTPENKTFYASLH